MERECTTAMVAMPCPAFSVPLPLNEAAIEKE